MIIYAYQFAEVIIKENIKRALKFYNERLSSNKKKRLFITSTLLSF